MEVIFGFSMWDNIRTFRLPPVMVTFTNRRVYVILFFARPFGVFFFSCGSTYADRERQYFAAQKVTIAAL
jgi:hypothetical protein